MKNKKHVYVRLVDKKNWDTQNFLRLYQALNCQNKVKIKLTFTITVDSYLDKK
jgi:hypothetical protein